MEATTIGTEVEDTGVATVPVMRYVTYTIGALGLAGNGFVIVVIVSGDRLRRQFTNGYITNQSVLDATSSLFLILCTALENDGRKFGGLLDEFYCRLWLTKVLLWGLFTASTYNLVLLAGERYLAVVHPIWHKTRLTKAKVVCSVAFVWAFGLAFNLAYAVPAAGISAGGECTVYSDWPDVRTRHAVGVLTIVVQFFAPFGLLVFFYARMIAVLRRRVLPTAGLTPAAAAAGLARRTNDSMSGARRNILKTLAVVGYCFVLCWIGNQVYFLLHNLGVGSVNFTNAFYNLTVVMVFVNCCINPFVYVFKYKEFQQRARRLISAKFKTSGDSSATRDGSTE